MHQKLIPVGALEPGAVITQVHNDMQTELLQPTPGERDSMLNKDISGGYIGAAQFALFLWLFGSLGARLIMIVMFIISFMLITNLSYVDLVRIFRTKVWDAGSSIYKSWSPGHPHDLLQHPREKGGAARKVVPIPADIEDDEEDDLEEMHLPKRKAPIFFQLFGKWGADRETSKSDREMEQEQPPAEQVLYRAEPDHFAESWTEEPSFVSDVPASTERTAAPKTSSAPIIRDFFEHVRSEDHVKDDDLDDAYPFPDDISDSSQDDDIPIKISDELVDGADWPVNEAGADDLSEMENSPEGQSGGVNDSSSVMNGESVEGQEMEPVKPPPPPPKPYKLPSFRLLAKPNNGGKGGDQKLYANGPEA